MFIARNNPQEKIWIPINMHITHERLQIFFTKFVAWLDMHMTKPWALFLPIKGSKLITDPLGFISIDDLDKNDLKLLDPSHCVYIYQVPTDPATREIGKVENSWIEYLRSEYENQLKEQCVFTHGDSVIFRETVYKNLRGIFQYHPDPVNPTYSTVAVNMFSAQFIVTVPSRYLEKHIQTDPPATLNTLSMFFTAASPYGPGSESDNEDDEVLD